MPVSIRSDYPLGTARGCTCYTCGADRPGEPVVDWHLFIDGEGQLRQCASCVIEAAGLLGMIHPEARDEAIAAMHEVQRAADEALAEAAEARALVEQMRAYDARRGMTPPDLDAEMNHSCSKCEPSPINSPPMSDAEREHSTVTAQKSRKRPTAKNV